MLVLTRRETESVLIGDDIELKILRIKGNQVRLGFAAPKEIDIVRSELLKKEPANE